MIVFSSERELAVRCLVPQQLQVNVSFSKQSSQRYEMITAYQGSNISFSESRYSHIMLNLHHILRRYAVLPFSLHI